MSIRGYCGECDKQIELRPKNTYIAVDEDGNEFVMIRCPWCDDYEEIK